MTGLLELAERCEQAAGGDWQLEQDIAAAVGYADFQSQPFTSSIDAAMTLVPDGWAVIVGAYPNARKAFARLFPPDYANSPLEEQESDDCASHALALCAAALRARSDAPEPQYSSQGEPMTQQSEIEEIAEALITDACFQLADGKGEIDISGGPAFVSLGGARSFELDFERLGRAAYEVMARSDGWLPIESAPKDGTRILALWPYNSSQSAFETLWDDDESQGDKPGWRPAWLLDGRDPTHWRPLPDPPPQHKGTAP